MPYSSNPAASTTLPSVRAVPLGRGFAPSLTAAPYEATSVALVAIVSGATMPLGAPAVTTRTRRMEGEEVGVEGLQGLVRGQGPLPLGGEGGSSCLPLPLPLGSNNWLLFVSSKVRTIISFLFIQYCLAFSAHIDTPSCT